MDMDLSGILKAEEISSLEQAREVIALQATIFEQLPSQIKILQTRFAKLREVKTLNSCCN